MTITAVYIMKILRVYSNRTKKIKCFKNDKMKIINRDKSSQVEDGGAVQNVDLKILIFWYTIGNMELEPLIAIPVFIHDFLCIHPFNDGNGRMSRLLTTLPLYRNGFYVGKYISLEAKIAHNKDLYYKALNQAQIGWHKGTEDVVPFIKYILGTVLAAYKDFEDRFSIIEKKLPAIDMVRMAVENKIGRFTKQDIHELCPSLSISSIESSLRKLVATGELKREGTGRATYYIRLF